VLLHGRGADELDLAPLLGALDPDEKHLGLLPRGPLALPPGGRHWYVVPRVGFPDPSTFLATFAALADWLDATLAENGVELGRTVVAGFSQGAVMALSLAFGAGRGRPAAVIAFSGFLPQVDGFELDPGAKAGLLVALSHGSLDPIIGVEFGREARARLESAGVAVRYREDPVGHMISPGALAHAKAVLDEALAD
jgi:phospholipase/carboxylesterase